MSVTLTSEQQERNLYNCSFRPSPLGGGLPPPFSLSLHLSFSRSRSPVPLPPSPSLLSFNFVRLRTSRALARASSSASHASGDSGRGSGACWCHRGGLGGRWGPGVEQLAPLSLASVVRNLAPRGERELRAAEGARRPGAGELVTRSGTRWASIYRSGPDQDSTGNVAHVTEAGSTWVTRGLLLLLQVPECNTSIGRLVTAEVRSGDQ